MQLVAIFEAHIACYQRSDVTGLIRSSKRFSFGDNNQFIKVERKGGRKRYLVLIFERIVDNGFLVTRVSKSIREKE